MIRMFIGLALGVALFGLVAWHMELLPWSKESTENVPGEQRRSNTPQIKLTGPLYTPARFVEENGRGERTGVAGLGVEAGGERRLPVEHRADRARERGRKTARRQRREKPTLVSIPRTGNSCRYTTVSIRAASCTEAS